MKTAHRVKQDPPPALPDRLDDMLALEGRDLRLLYEAALTPRLVDLDGSFRGRLLAIPGVYGLPAAAARALARWDRFPWRGKSFQSHGERGEGKNRLFVDRFQAWPFSTAVGPSRAGAFDAVHLDYSRPGNPFYLRHIRDEVRMLRPGLFLGQAYLVLGKPRLLMYFGLEA